MINRWNYSGLGQVQYGDIPSYTHACKWLDIGGILEDWGCGCAFAKQFVTHSTYRGIDGSTNSYADVCGVDLENYRSDCDCLLLRHVLDHNEGWKKILQNALASFRKRMVVVFFIEFGELTKVVSRSDSPLYLGVPDIQFRKQDILDLTGPLLKHEERIPTNAGNGYVDTLFYLEKDSQ